MRMTKRDGCGTRPFRARVPRHCFVFWLATFAIALSSAMAPAQSISPMRHGGGHGKPAPDRDGNIKHGPFDTSGVSIVDRPPHGGQITRDLIYYFEVVYQPRETHLYIYGPTEEPLPSQAVQGEIVMKPHYLDQTFRCALKYVEPPPGQHPNHLVAATEVSGVPDGEMTVTFQLQNLFLPQRTQTAFTQTFALTRLPPPVTVVEITEADRPGIERQQVCPVTGARLGSMGPPVKVLIGQQPLYVCCQACVAKIQQEPEKYLPATVQH